MTSATHPYVGKGLYSIADAARLVGDHYNKVRRWLDPGEGVIHRRFSTEDRVISFAELMELHFIKMFRDEGVSLQAIRKAAKTASKQFGTEYPFAVKRFDTDGRTIFATLVKETGDKELVEDLKKGQYVFAHIVRPFFRKLDYSTTADISHYWPQGKRGRIVLDPQRQFGRPIDSETGVPTKALYQAFLTNEQSIRKVADWYSVPEKAVRAAVKFERSLAA